MFRNGRYEHQKCSYRQILKNITRYSYRGIKRLLHKIHCIRFYLGYFSSCHWLQHRNQALCFCCVVCSPRIIHTQKINNSYEKQISPGERVERAPLSRRMGGVAQ